MTVLDFAIVAAPLTIALLVLFSHTREHIRQQMYQIIADDEQAQPSAMKAVRPLTNPTYSKQLASTK